MQYLSILVGLLLVVGPAVAHDCRGYGHHNSTGWHDCGDCARSGPCARRSSLPVETLSGTLSEINGAPAGTGVVEAWLKTGAGTILVRLGPADFLRQNGVALQEGAAITVKGVRAASSGNDLFIATEVEAGGKSLSLRGANGKPLW